MADERTDTLQKRLLTSHLLQNKPRTSFVVVVCVFFFFIIVPPLTFHSLGPCKLPSEILFLFLLVLNESQSAEGDDTTH